MELNSSHELSFSTLKSENTLSQGAFFQPPKLTSLCKDKLLELFVAHGCPGRVIKDLYKFVPDDLLDPVFEKFLETSSVTDVAVMTYLSSNRVALRINHAVKIRNCIFKLIGLQCPNLIKIDLSDCIQVSNSVVRSILQGCSKLQEIILNRCKRISDSAFDFASSPFESFQACFTLKHISLQGCPQITGEIISTLTKNFRELVSLNLSQCKQVKSTQLLGIFTNSMMNLKYLNLAYIDDVNDDAFVANNSIVSPLLLSEPIRAAANHQLNNLDSAGEHSHSELEPILNIFQDFGNGESEEVHQNEALVVCTSKLETLNLCKSRITDHSITSMLRYIPTLLSLSIPYCSHITDAGIGALVTSCPLIQTLDMKSCDHITDQSLTSIGQHCVNLMSLDISWCYAISNNGLHNLILPSYGSQILQLQELKVLWCRGITASLFELWCEELPVDKLKKIFCQGCAFLISNATTSLVGEIVLTGIAELQSSNQNQNFEMNETSNNLLSDRHKLIQLLKYEKGMEVIL